MKNITLNKALRKSIYSDCRKAMRSTAVLYSLENISSDIIAVYTASVLGLFADAVLNLNIAYGLDNLWKIVLCIVATVVIVPLLGLWGEISMFKNSLKHDRLVLSHFLNKSYQDVIKIDRGEAQKRLEDDPVGLRIGWLFIVTKAVAIPIATIYLLYQTLQISAIFTAIVFVVSLIKFSVPIAVKNAQAKYDKETRAYNTDVRTVETDIVARPHIAKLYGLSEALIGRLNRKYKDYYKNTFVRSVKVNTLAKSVTAFLDTFCTLIILIVGAVIVANGMISVGAVAAMVGYFAVFNTIIANVSYIITQVPIMRNVVERMEVLYEGCENMSGQSIDKIDTICVDSLSFSYDGEHDIFKNLAFETRQGEKTVIVGENGSGKSTFVKLLCGLIKGYSGSLRFGKTELSAVSMKEWRNRIAYAAQEPYLFEGSVRENVHLGNLDASNQIIDEIMEQIGIIYLADRVVTMSQNDLSGGEKQKISIAMALVKNTDVLLLDEPSNNLDSATNDWLCDFIANFPKTIFYVSHDNYLSSQADKQVRF